MFQQEHSAILSTFIKLHLLLRSNLFVYFNWPFYTGFTVLSYSLDIHVTYVFVPQKILFTETVLLSRHNIRFN